MPDHPGTSDLFFGFLDRGGSFSEAMQQDSGAVFIEKVQDAIPCFAYPQSGFSELAFDLRSVRIVQSRSTCFEQVDARQHLTSNLFGHTVEPDTNGKCPVLLGVKVDLPEFGLRHTHRLSLSYLINQKAPTSRPGSVGFWFPASRLQ